MSGPFYGCEHGDCAENVCYPADCLRVYQGKPYCMHCWEEMPLIAVTSDEHGDIEESLRWHDLPAFVPDHEATISDLRDRLELDTVKRETAQKFAELMAVDRKAIGILFIGYTQAIEDIIAWADHASDDFKEMQGYEDCVRHHKKTLGGTIAALLIERHKVESE